MPREQIRTDCTNIIPTSVIGRDDAGVIWGRGGVASTGRPPSSAEGLAAGQHFAPDTGSNVPPRIRIALPFVAPSSGG